jgi:hypothetical protein
VSKAAGCRVKKEYVWSGDRSQQAPKKGQNQINPEPTAVLPLASIQEAGEPLACFVWIYVWRVQYEQFGGVAERRADVLLVVKAFLESCICVLNFVKNAGEETLLCRIGGGRFMMHITDNEQIFLISVENNQVKLHTFLLWILAGRVIS